MTTNGATVIEPEGLTRKDFVSAEEPRWCAGCGDYSLLAQVQRVLPTLGIPKEDFVVVSGIGCSSRFPYYMNTYGMHGIHGRALPIATGIKLSRPELSVWVVTGDGDNLAIGGNHLIHALRRNVGVKILMCNNRIYGLTKGQCSPTSELDKKTKTTPFGSVEAPLDPVSVALGAGATFVARTIASDARHLRGVIERAAEHEGTAFVEILQECVIFNPQAYQSFVDRQTKDESRVVLEHGQPLRFGENRHKAIALDGRLEPVVVDAEQCDEARLLVHDERSDVTQLIISRLAAPDFPVPFGVLRAVSHPTLEEQVQGQIEQAQASKSGSVQDLLTAGHTWHIEQPDEDESSAVRSSWRP